MPLSAVEFSCSSLAGLVLCLRCVCSLARPKVRASTEIEILDCFRRFIGRLLLIGLLEEVVRLWSSVILVMLDMRLSLSFACLR